MSETTVIYGFRGEINEKTKALYGRTLFIAFRDLGIQFALNTIERLKNGDYIIIDQLPSSEKPFKDTSLCFEDLFNYSCENKFTDTIRRLEEIKMLISKKD